MAPVNLPPWSPGMAPPIPGPVFSQAFIALLVLMGGGCCVLCYQLYDKLGAAMGSKIGEDNEILVGGRGAEGGADWLRGVQASRGRVAVRLPESGLRAGDARARRRRRRRRRGPRLRPRATSTRSSARSPKPTVCNSGLPPPSARAPRRRWPPYVMC